MRDDSASKLGQSLHRLGHQGDMRDDSTSKLPLSLGKKKKKGKKENVEHKYKETIHCRCVESLCLKQIYFLKELVLRWLHSIQPKDSKSAASSCQSSHHPPGDFLQVCMLSVLSI